MAGLVHQAQHEVHLLVLDPDHHGRVGLPEEPARRVQARGAVLPGEERVDQRSGVFVVHDGDDQLHEAESSPPPRVDVGRQGWSSTGAV